MQVFIKIIATDKQTMREKCNSSSISYNWNNVLILLAWNVASCKHYHFKHQLAVRLVTENIQEKETEPNFTSSILIIWDLRKTFFYLKNMYLT